MKARVWSTEEVGAWLEEVGLGELKKLFAEHRIYGTPLLSLTDADFDRLGISAFGLRRGLSIEIARLRQRQQQQHPLPPPKVISAPESTAAAVVKEEKKKEASSSSAVHEAVARAMGKLWPAEFAARFRETIDSHVASTLRVRDAIAKHRLTDDEACAVAYYLADARAVEGGVSEMSVSNEMGRALSASQQQVSAWHDFIAVLESALRKLPAFTGKVRCTTDRPLSQHRVGKRLCWNTFTICSKRRDWLFAASVGKQSVCLSLQLTSARDVSELSISHEGEVVLLPNTEARVKELVTSPEVKNAHGIPANIDLVCAEEISPTSLDSSAPIASSPAPAPCVPARPVVESEPAPKEKKRHRRASEEDATAKGEKKARKDLAERRKSAPCRVNFESEMLKGLKGIQNIIKALSDFADDQAACTVACKALHSLSENDEARVQIASEGGIALIIGTLKRHADNADVCEAACNALRSLSFKDENRIQIATKGGIAPIVRALEKHTDKLESCTAACYALWCLSSKDENVAEIARNGGIAALIKALKTFPDNALVCAFTCDTLSRLSFNDENKETIKEAVRSEPVLTKFHHIFGIAGAVHGPVSASQQS